MKKIWDVPSDIIIFEKGFAVDDFIYHSIGKVVKTVQTLFPHTGIKLEFSSFLLCILVLNLSVILKYVYYQGDLAGIYMLCAYYKLNKDKTY